MHSIRVGEAISRLLVTTAAAGMVPLVSRKYAGVGQRYTGATPPRRERKRESRTGVHGRERVVHIARVREPVCSFSTKRPVRYRSLPRK